MAVPEILQNINLQFESFELDTTTMAIIIAFCATWIVISILVYRDAKKRGMSGVLWLIIVIFANIIGIIIYFVVREPKRAPEAELPSSPPPYTRMTAPPGVDACKRCGAPLGPDTKFCKNCGYRV